MDQDLNLALPEEMRVRAALSGNELVLSREDAIAAIAIGTERQIVILGVEFFDVKPDGFQVLDFSAYESEIMLRQKWAEFVTEMNIRAERWVIQQPEAETYGYILISASLREWDKLVVMRETEILRKGSSRS
jgi:hypothetical protein